MDIMDILILVLLVVAIIYGIIAAGLFVALVCWAATNFNYEDGSPVGIVLRISYVALGAILVIVWPIFLWKGLKAQELTAR